MHISIAIVASTPPDVILEQVTGTFKDCDGNSVTNKYVVINYDAGQLESFVSDGTFDFSLTRCTDSPTIFTYYGVDLIGF